MSDSHRLSYSFNDSTLTTSEQSVVEEESPVSVYLPPIACALGCLSQIVMILISRGNLFLNHFCVSHDEIRNPREVWARRAWFVEKGIWCERAQSLDNDSVAPFRLAHIPSQSVPFGLYK